MALSPWPSDDSRAHVCVCVLKLACPAHNVRLVSGFITALCEPRRRRLDRSHTASRPFSFTRWSFSSYGNNTRHTINIVTNGSAVGDTDIVFY